MCACVSVKENTCCYASRGPYEDSVLGKGMLISVCLCACPQHLLVVLLRVSLVKRVVVDLGYEMEFLP